MLRQTWLGAILLLSTVLARADFSAGVDAYRSIYIGDAARDIEAGLRAGMATIAAGYGYITHDDDPREWGADIIAPDTEELTQIVLKAVNLEP